jgi:hypothetical protein
VNDEGSGYTDLGPPPRSSIDWLFTTRPGRALDAADVRLVKRGRPARRSRGFLAAALHLLASLRH